MSSAEDKGAAPIKSRKDVKRRSGEKMREQWNNHQERKKRHARGNTCRLWQSQSNRFAVLMVY